MRTSDPDVFAAGDVATTTEQVLVAVGEGVKAALSAYEYLEHRFGMGARVYGNLGDADRKLMRGLARDGLGGVREILGSVLADELIDPETGLVEWTPTADQIGAHAVDLHVEDVAGATAPQHFTLTVIGLADQDGQLHSLEDYRDSWVVLYFYPKDNTPGCTKQACSFRDNWATLKKRKVKVYGFSPDSTARHQKFTEKYELPFPLLVQGDEPRGRLLARFRELGELIAQLEELSSLGIRLSVDDFGTGDSAIVVIVQCGTLPFSFSGSMPSSAALSTTPGVEPSSPRIGLAAISSFVGSGAMSRMPVWHVSQQPCSLSSAAMVASCSFMPCGAPGRPTLESPVRKAVCPVMKVDRPAVQDCSA